MDNTPDTPPAAPFRGGRGLSQLADWAPSRTQSLVLIIGLLTASNLAQWLTLAKNPDTRPVTVVAVRQMTRDYMRKITSPQLTEQQSVLRANLFVAAAQDELRRLAPGNQLVLARECVLAGTLNDITAQLQKRVEAKLAQDPAALSQALGPARSPAGDPILASPVSAANLLSPSVSGGGGQ